MLTICIAVPIIFPIPAPVKPTYAPYRSLAMLTENFITSSQDAAIHIHSLHPSYRMETSFKKCSTPTNCLAVTPTHIYAAQAGKAVVHVYSRERCNQEATIPFPERIRSVAFAGHGNGAGILILGTDGGRVILWEVCIAIFFVDKLTVTSRCVLDVRCLPNHPICSR